MKIIDFQEIDSRNGKKVVFMRVDPEDISITLRDIITELSNYSWIAKFDEEYMRSSYATRAEASVKYICKSISLSQSDPVTEDAAEYIVSELAREAIVLELKYKDVPLGELIKEQVAGNPGFDFFSQTLEEIILFGEAKYLADRNAYGAGMKQVSRFIQEKRDIADLIDIQSFFSSAALDGVAQGKKAFSVAFSAKQTSSDTLIKHIQANKNYEELSSFNELVFVAVNI